MGAAGQAFYAVTSFSCASISEICPIDSSTCLAIIFTAFARPEITLGKYTASDNLIFLGHVSKAWIQRIPMTILPELWSLALIWFGIEPSSRTLSRQRTQIPHLPFWSRSYPMKYRQGTAFPVSMSVEDSKYCSCSLVFDIISTWPWFEMWWPVVKFKTTHRKQYIHR